jgi:hypothetical protein
MAGVSGQMLKFVLMRPTPLILLAVGIFYLWVYVRRDLGRVAPAEPEEMEKVTLESTIA